MKKITLVFLLLFSIFSYGQFNVNVTNMTVNNTNATAINFGTNISQVNIALTVNISAGSIPSDSAPGSVNVYYKRNSSLSASPISPSGGNGGQVFFLGGYSAIRSFQLALNASEFDNTDGFLYVEYKSYSGVSYTSNKINVTKATTTTPTTPTTPNSNWNIISFDYLFSQFNLTINEGESVPLIVGTDADQILGKLYQRYSYSYQWSKETGGGVFVPIEGATSMHYYPQEVLVTTKFKRTVTYHHYGITSTVDSNVRTVTVNPAPELKNNSITLNGSIISGSLPTGGLGHYEYSWMLLGAEDPYTFPETGKDLELSESLYNYLLWYPNAFIKRFIKSGSQTIVSGSVKVPPISLPVLEIQNNTIAINGYQVTGSQPTGGGGDYRYSWFLGSQEDPIWFEETSKDLNLAPYFRAISILQTDPSAMLVRIVRSIKSSTSNKINLYGVSALKKQNLRTLSEEDSILVYPNPTTEVVNFVTNFSTNKEIEIVVYSETIRNEKSVFKGTVTPNQVVSWNIPSGYAKGIYFYKIRSGNEEIKTGKIIVQ
ncbi:T9SS type A sorting domain-containing protein [Flavobacterium collinsii]|uniref:Secretion system C-terminal sorting domain-containing protein n=1 Tax=Flavobacterium collinsii TaxID=1114861 RepID=A0A9W4TCD6_9FLAO|nr:T9SS type A sorting domain-containing protein [Flavobacterium collinsii]CAA9202886.1 hypothetical protein FLACOL7796_04516 [Flavobacterium collinsii]CAI2765334.1 conserved protein of unknown function precursor containing a type A C-terminal secretion signal [Flavobacterium collinsii]